MSKHTIIETEFATLSNGSLVELVENPNDATSNLLAVYRDGAVTFASEVPNGDTILTPLPKTVGSLQHVRLASGVVLDINASDAFKAAVSLLNDCLDVNSDSLSLMGSFVESTYFPEKLSVAPYLSLVGPPGSGKTTAMRILNLLCYRSLLTADITSSAFYDISNRLRPTILVDETLTAGPKRELMHLLRTSSTRDCVSLRKGKAHLAFGPKVFAWVNLPDDPALNSRCLIIPMHISSREVKYLNSAEVLERAAEIRKILLGLRLQRFDSLALPKTAPTSRLIARPLDLYRALAFPFQDSPLFCKYLADRVAAQSILQARPLSPAQIATIGVLHRFIHATTITEFPMADLAYWVNMYLRGNGEAGDLNERKIGSILTTLSLTRRSRRNTGYVLILDRSERVLIHEMARNYRVVGTQLKAAKECELCREARRPLPIPPPVTIIPELDSPVEAEGSGNNGVRPRRAGRVRRARAIRRSKSIG